MFAFFGQYQQVDVIVIANGLIVKGKGSLLVEEQGGVAALGGAPCGFAGLVHDVELQRRGGLAEIVGGGDEIGQQRLVGDEYLALSPGLHIGLGDAYLLSDKEDITGCLKVQGLALLVLGGDFQLAQLADLIVLALLNLTQLARLGEHRPEDGYLVGAVAQAVLVLQALNADVVDLLLGEGKLLCNRMQAVVGGQHHRPVVDETLTDSAVIDLALDLFQGPLPCAHPSGIEIVAIPHHAYGNIGGAHISQLHELLIPVGLFLGALTTLGLQEYQPAEEGDVDGGHLLTGKDNTAGDIGGLTTLAIGGTLGASCTVVDAFQEVYMLLAQ